MRDIQTYEDMLHIVTEFYKKLMIDPIIGFFFTDIAKINLPEHLPKIARFWAFQILGEKAIAAMYSMCISLLHNQAAMNEDHFHRWVFFLVQTIDHLYAGPNADMMKWKAEAIAKKMSYALGIRGDEQPELLGVQTMEPR
ncbi:MAG: group III truncated hemoglobin [Pseudomonadales bacterium]